MALTHQFGMSAYHERPSRRNDASDTSLAAPGNDSGRLLTDSDQIAR
jgi:hypothetical protein